MYKSTLWAAKCTTKEWIMKIIISPAKKMNYETDLLDWSSLPIFLDEATQLMEYLKGLSYQSLKQLWNCNDKIAQLNYLSLIHISPSLIWAVRSSHEVAFEALIFSPFFDAFLMLFLSYGKYLPCSLPL